MTAQEPSEPVESSTEWGVRWRGGFWSPRSRVDDPEKCVREFAKGLHPGDRPEVVCRTVTRSPWRSADLNADGGDSGA